MSFRIFRAHTATYIESTESPGLFRHVSEKFSFNGLFTAEDPFEYTKETFKDASEGESFDPKDIDYAAPVGDQEVWAAGVTYFRSKTARMEEAEKAGGDVFYDKVYEAERPELFFKSSAAKVRGHLDNVGIRSDSTWNVPEPELTLAISSSGKVFGYTIGNDMSSRSIEGENPLYLPQAKVYKGSCSIGPSLRVGAPPSPDTAIKVEIQRGGEDVFCDATDVSQIKRSLDELADFLFRSNEFAKGAYLMTGTGIVPGSDFTLKAGDRIYITIDGIGTLTNDVETV